VALRNAATNHEEARTTTDQDGYFEFQGLSLGSYLIVVEAEAFETAEISAEVGTRPARSLSVHLRLAQVKQQVSVSARASPSAQANIDVIELNQQWLENLPLQEGDPLAIPSLFLEPAALGAQGPEIIVDGVPTSALDIPISSIKAVYVNRSPYSAEFGRPGKARIEVITRRGSHHKYRGSIYFLGRNSALDARNAFAADKPPLQRDIVEALLSGPLGRNVTFLISGRYLARNDTSVVNAETTAGPLVENFGARARNGHLFGQLYFDLSHTQKLTVTYKYKNKSKRGQGVGGFNLPERATDSLDHQNEVKVLETATVGDHFINQARFTYGEETQNTSSQSEQRAITVLDAFSGGGAQIFQRQREKVVNFQDIVTFVKGAHSLRFGAGVRPRFFDAFDASNFGGTFTFSSLATFTAGQPFLFTMNEGNPEVSFTQHEISAFLEDEFRSRPDLSVSLGLRYEFQSNLDEHKNFAPRLALAYAPGGGRTVVRAGAGIFYDRQPPIMQQQALLYDGFHVQQIVISDPGFPQPSGGAISAPPSVRRIDLGIRAPYLIQASVGLERKLGRGRNYLAVDYTTLRGVRLYRTRNINAPFPGSTIRPNPNFTNIDQFESSGTSRSNTLTVTLQWAFRRTVNFLAQYRYSRSWDDTSGLFSLPANNYDLRGEWGRSDFDQRHRLNLIGVYRLPFGFKAGSVVNWYSGIPFNVTTGFDNDHDTVANDRPPGVDRNTGNGPGYANVDLHLAKAFRVNRDRPRPRFEIGLDAFDVFNHVNFQNFVGTLTSPFFGHANAAKPARELQLSLKFDF